MNNKKLGSDFEKAVCHELEKLGYWVHFLTPDRRGAQPFDIIAVKDDSALAVECKTLSASQKYFSINRIEQNQQLAFEKWIACGNRTPIIAIWYKEHIYYVHWNVLKENGKVQLDNQ